MISYALESAELFALTRCHRTFGLCCLGQLWEKEEDESRAITHYEKALEQWRNADEDMPELLDTRASLAGLNLSPQ